MFCLYTFPLTRPAQAKIQNLTGTSWIVKLIPWTTVNLSHLYNFFQKGWKNMVWNWGYNHRRQRFVKHNCSEWWFDLKIWSRTRKSFYSLCNQRFFVDFHRFSSSGFWLGSIQQKTVAYNKLFSPCFDTAMGSIQRKTR